MLWPWALEEVVRDFGMLLAAWMLEDVLAKATRVVDSLLKLLIERVGEFGAAWRRVVNAVHAARARWHE